MVESLGSPIRRMDEQDLNFLLNYEKHAAEIRRFDVASKSLVQAVGAGSEALEWPVVWLLSRHTRRHAFATARSITREEMRKHAQLLGRKVCWSWHHCYSEDTPFMKLMGFECSPHSGPRPPLELMAWLGEVR